MKSHAYVSARLRVVLIASIAFGLFAANPGHGAPPRPPRATVTVTFADGSSVTLFSVAEAFLPIRSTAGEALTIKAQLPRGMSNAATFVHALDGGTVTSGLIIAPDGSASLGFRVGVQPGLYRLLVSVRGRTGMLQFQVPPQA